MAYSLGQQVVQCLRCLPLLTFEQVCVDVHGERCGGVTQPPGYGEDIDAVPEPLSGCCVTEGVPVHGAQAG